MLRFERSSAPASSKYTTACHRALVAVNHDDDPLNSRSSTQSPCRASASFASSHDMSNVTRSRDAPFSQRKSSTDTNRPISASRSGTVSRWKCATSAAFAAGSVATADPISTMSPARTSAFGSTASCAAAAATTALDAGFRWTPEDEL